MNKIREKIYDIFKWDLNDFFKAILGICLFSFAINIFIVPNDLYSGRVLGFAQVLRSLILMIFDFETEIDISGLINFCINVPLFIMAYKNISKSFFSRTLLCVLIQTVTLTIIPTPSKPIINDLLTSVLIGGIIDGIGCGLVLSAGSSTGGTDIIGVAVASKNRNLSVGKLGLAINIVIFAICGIMYGVEIMIYSIICSVVATLMIDNTHEQNICSTAIIFTKKKPTKIVEFVQKELNRDVTYWEAIGSYSNTKTYISYVALSKYELQRLERHLHTLDKNAFVVKSDGYAIKGEFEKVLT